jgi:hypothetical protein
MASTARVVLPGPARYYRTDSRIAGVRANTPSNLRVEHLPHEEFSAPAVILYDEERKDHVLVKVEAVPGIREENEYGFKWMDPVTGQARGALVAFPPSEWSVWDCKRRVWCRGGSSRRLSGSREVWPAMGPALPEGRVR